MVDEATVLGFTGFGFLLGVFSIPLSEMAEGPAFALSVFGAPFTITANPLLVPIVWLALGVSLSRRRPLVDASVARRASRRDAVVCENMKTGSLAEKWALQKRLLSADPVVTPALCLVYVAGYTGAWTLVVRARRAA